jgi:uncharacterized SAM-binding protein YcdF (DUF218 family)
MFFLASKILGYLLAPVHVAIFLCAVGATLLYTRWQGWGRALATVGAFALLLMGFTPLGDMLAAPLESRFHEAPRDLPAPPDGIIVLGGAADAELSAERNWPSLSEAAERLTTPIALMRKYPQARLIFSGGSAAPPGFPEIEVAKQFWSDAGVDESRVIFEGRSRNTVENAVFTRELVQPKAGERWLLVTSAMHMPRAIGVFRKAGFPVIAFPVDYRTHRDIWRLEFPGALRALSLVESAAHEWAGLLAYWLTGKTDALFPAP